MIALLRCVQLLTLLPLLRYLQAANDVSTGNLPLSTLSEATHYAACALCVEYQAAVPPTLTDTVLLSYVPQPWKGESGCAAAVREAVTRVQGRPVSEIRNDLVLGRLRGHPLYGSLYFKARCVGSCVTLAAY